jgi:hypothetical protein
MVYFHTKNPNSVFFGGPRNGKCWYIIRPFGTLVVSWNIFPSFGEFYQEKFGNPGIHIRSKTPAKLNLHYVETQPPPQPHKNDLKVRKKGAYTEKFEGRYCLGNYLCSWRKETAQRLR